MYERIFEWAGHPSDAIENPSIEKMLVVPVKQTAPYRNSSANRTDTLLLRRSRSSSFLTGISDLMVGAFLI